MTSNTLPGYGQVYRACTRDGHLLSITVGKDGHREIAFYLEADPDTPIQTIRLDQDESNILAELLHTEEFIDRLTALERQVARLSAGAV